MRIGSGIYEAVPHKCFYPLNIIGVEIVYFCGPGGTFVGVWEVGEEHPSVAEGYVLTYGQPPGFDP